MIWNESKECMSREQMHDLQSKRLRKLVSTVYHNTPFYRRKMQEMDITPDDIRSIDDIVKLPFTTKQDLRDNYPFGLQAVPTSEIVRIHAIHRGQPVIPPRRNILGMTSKYGRKALPDVLRHTGSHATIFSR